METEAEGQMVSLDAHSNYAAAFRMTQVNKCFGSGKWSCGHHGSHFEASKVLQSYCLAELEYLEDLENNRGTRWRGGVLELRRWWWECDDSHGWNSSNVGDGCTERDTHMVAKCSISLSEGIPVILSSWVWACGSNELHRIVSPSPPMQGLQWW